MSIPIEFLNKMKTLLGQEYEDFIKSYNEERFYGLRINTLKVSVERFLQLSTFKLEKVPWVNEGFYYNHNDKLTKHPYYFAGLYYIQEPSAMAPGDVINVVPNDRVLDLCAAPGGKSTQIAAKLAGQGLLVTNDINPSRVKALVKNIELYGIKNAVITNENPERLAEKFPTFFDKIVVDAPCSGEGMFRKDDSAGKSWNIYSTKKCSLMQKNILDLASKMLKPQGYILYSTCTFSPEENECIIDDFLKNNKNFELIDIPKHSGIDKGRSDWCGNNEQMHRCARFWPHKIKGEGHFLALLRKTDGEQQQYSNYNKILDNKLLTNYYRFCEEYLNTIPKGVFEMYGDYLYLLPDKIPNLNGVKVIRPGWFLGINKKYRFEPSHALAMALERHDIKSFVNMDSNSLEVTKYLKGDTLEIDSKKGWNVVCVDGFPLGWAKGLEGVLKNYYPTGWRLIN